MKYLAVLVLSLVVSAGCQQPRDVQTSKGESVVVKEVVQLAPVEASPTDPGFYYSPFFVQVNGSEFFHSISFKDVGLKRTSKDPNDPLLEIIAESLSQHLTDSGIGMMTQVSYDEGLLDPNNHTFCGQHHIYVDVWRKSDDAWGYSLWSGCGEDDNFAWIELPSIRNNDIAISVEPLTQSIVQSLTKASQSSCFQKSC